MAAAGVAALGLRSPIPAPEPYPYLNAPVKECGGEIVTPDLINQWYGRTMITDVDCPEDRIFFIVQTRLHPDDLMSRAAAGKNLRAWVLNA
jgi:hypothetical protein